MNIVIFVLIVLSVTLVNASPKRVSQPMTEKPYRFSQSATMQTKIDRIQYDSEYATVTMIKGRLYAPLEPVEVHQRNKDKTLYQKIAVDFINHYRQLFKLKTPRKELVVTRTQIDNLDYKHIRLQQVYKGIPVWNSEIIVHINTDEIVYLAGGHYIPTPHAISEKPAFNEQQALDYARKPIPGLPGQCSRCTAKLVIYYDATTSPRLAYHVEFSAGFSTPTQLILDAQTGKLITRLPRIQTSTSLSNWKVPIIR